MVYLLLLACISIANAQEATVLERYSVYEDGVAPEHEVAPWNMQWDERLAAEPTSRHLWFNDDWQAKPWAGVTFRRTEGDQFVLTEEWLETGFFRFMLNAGLDRYGSPNAPLDFQIRLMTDGCRYQRLRARFIDRGRGLDEDPETWQEVLVPLSYWTDLEARARVDGLAIQCYLQPIRSFGLDEVGLVRYDWRPAWLDALNNVHVAQPWVTWPEYDELPDILKADQHPPQVRDGRFLWPDGSRCFLMSPYLREDPRLVYWGGLDPSSIPPDHGLYDPEVHGWIYDEVPTAQTLCRLGFNSCSATMPGQPWWDAVGLEEHERGQDAGRLATYGVEVGLPFYVDLVCWPWTLGKPAEKPQEAQLPAAAFTEGRHHWTPYRIIGAGREAWLRMWRLYADRYREAEVPVVAVELMNEPAYIGISADHKAEFMEWLERHYGDLGTLNATWGTEYADWAEATAFESPDDLRDTPGLWFDYDEYLAERFTDLIAEGVRTVTAIQPEALVGLQTMGGFVLSPREAVWKHRIVQHETVVLTPTGGGRWTHGGSASRRPSSAVEAPMAPAPLENDLLLALAGEKMTVDNETYLSGQTARDTRNRLWRHVIAGVDGLTVFSWSKRGWAWWKTRAEVVTEADKFPYSALIPLARRTEALRGILEFADEVQPLADLILPKPWGPDPSVGLLYDWADVRRRGLEPERISKTPAYYAALKYSHANLQVVPSDRFMAGDAPAVDVLVAGGISHVEPELLPALEAFVKRGGVLVIGEAPMHRDLYGRPLDTSTLLDGTGDGSVLVTDRDGEPVVRKHARGEGSVYSQSADVVGYRLAELLTTILQDAVGDEWRLARIVDERGEPATNVLLSRRSYEDHHALLLMNRDGYDKRLRVLMNLGAGPWRVIDGIRGQSIEPPAVDGWTVDALATDGLPVALTAGDVGVILIER